MFLQCRSRGAPWQVSKAHRSRTSVRDRNGSCCRNSGKNSPELHGRARSALLCISPVVHTQPSRSQGWFARSQFSPTRASDTGRRQRRHDTHARPRGAGQGSAIFTRSLGSRGSRVQPGGRPDQWRAHEARTRRADPARPQPHSVAACPPLLLPRPLFAFLFQSRRHVAVAALPSPPPRRFCCRWPLALPRTYRRLTEPISSGRFPSTAARGRAGEGDRTRARAGRPAGIFYQDRSSGPGGRAHHEPRCGRRACSGWQAVRPLRFCPPLARPTRPLRCAFAVVADGVQCSRAASSGSGSFFDAGKRALACRHAPVTPSPSGPPFSSLRRSFLVPTLFDSGVSRHQWMLLPVRARRGAAAAAAALHVSGSRHATNTPAQNRSVLRAGQAQALFHQLNFS